MQKTISQFQCSLPHPCEVFFSFANLLHHFVSPGCRCRIRCRPASFLRPLLLSRSHPVPATPSSLARRGRSHRRLERVRGRTSPSVGAEYPLLSQAFYSLPLARLVWRPLADHRRALFVVLADWTVVWPMIKSLVVIFSLTLLHGHPYRYNSLTAIPLRWSGRRCRRGEKTPCAL